MLARGLPAEWLVPLRQVGEVPSVLSWGLGLRPWAVQLGNWLLTSWFTLCSHNLCLRGTLRLQEMDGLGDPVELVGYRI